MQKDKYIIEKLFEVLEEQNILIERIDSKIDDGSFELDFLSNKGLSIKQLPLIEGKLLKKLKNVSKEELSKYNLTKNVLFVKLRGVSGIELKEETELVGNKIFGICDFLKDDLEKSLKEIEDRESRDHRKIAKELELFFIDEIIGKGLPIWLPNGLILKNKIKEFILEQENKYGYLQVETPVLGFVDLYKISGHYYHYKENMFPEMKIDEKEAFMLRPMACPHHVMVYKHKQHSYRDLPVRIAEQVKQYRFEHSGSLIGLERVRAMELTDAHIFLREDQLYEEINNVYEMIEETLNKFDIDIDYIELALHDKNDKEKYHGDNEMWLKSEKILEDFLKDKGVKFIKKEGEAAFYGPKIDIQIRTALNHIITMSTIQLDFFLPSKFEISYINDKAEKVMPIMIHRGHIGTYERFISILLEQTKGNLPMWLTPKQAVIIPVSENNNEYSKKVFNLLNEKGIRVSLDDSNERISNKIRIHQTSKVKVQLIVGDKEQDENIVSYRYYGEEETNIMPLNQIEKIFN